MLFRKYFPNFVDIFKINQTTIKMSDTKPPVAHTGISSQATPQRRIDRLDRYIAFKGYNDNKITKESGISVGTLGKSRKEGKDITGRTCEAILARYPELSRAWLMEGIGEMIIDQTKPDFTTFPYIEDITAECGPAAGTFDAASFSKHPRLGVPGVPRDTDFFIRAQGFSMLNPDSPELSIPPGALVGLARINGNIVRWGETYALATPDGIMLKRVFPGEDKDKIRCVSYNSTEYPEFTIDRSDIRDVARITCVIPVYVR